MKLAGTATAVAAQANGQFKVIKALAFDAYGTLFDVFSVTALCEQLFPGRATSWRKSGGSNNCNTAYCAV